MVLLWASGLLISGTMVLLRGAGFLKLGVRLRVGLGEPRLLPVGLKLERLVEIPLRDVPMPLLMERLRDVPIRLLMLRLREVPPMEDDRLVPESMKSWAKAGELSSTVQANAAPIANAGSKLAFVNGLIGSPSS
jgi:hypothetical protein